MEPETDDEQEGHCNEVATSTSYSSISVSRTPPQLRRLIKKIRVPLTAQNYILLLYECRRIVKRYAGSSPLWLQHELTISLLNEIDSLDQFDTLFPTHIRDLQQLVDSGALDEIESSRQGCCGCWFCC